MYDTENFIGWAAAYRGFLESAGDTLDALIQVPGSLALNKRLVAQCLAGTKKDEILAPKELEHSLDHFAHARWMRVKRGEENIRKAKDNVSYIGALKPVIPDVETLYHKLCSVCHPSNSSIEYLYVPSPEGGFCISFKADAHAISALFDDYPDVLVQALTLHSNVPLLILRVLHKFGMHPQLKILNKLKWDAIENGAEIERILRT
jgi:hypothetical protein